MLGGLLRLLLLALLRELPESVDQLIFFDLIIHLRIGQVFLFRYIERAIDHLDIRERRRLGNVISFIRVFAASRVRNLLDLIVEIELGIGKEGLAGLPTAPGLDDGRG